MREVTLNNNNRNFSPGMHYLTVDSEAVHIKTDIIIGDYEEKSKFNLRKDKYFGEKSMLRMLHKEENAKLE